MAIKDPTEKKSRILDKAYLRRKVEEMHAALGIEFDPNATALQAQALAIAEGSDRRTIWHPGKSSACVMVTTGRTIRTNRRWSSFYGKPAPL